MRRSLVNRYFSDGPVGVVIEVEFPEDDPTLRLVLDKKGRDIYIYPGDVDLEKFPFSIYKI